MNDRSGMTSKEKTCQKLDCNIRRVSRTNARGDKEFATDCKARV